LGSTVDGEEEMGWHVGMGGGGQEGPCVQVQVEMNEFEGPHPDRRRARAPTEAGGRAGGRARRGTENNRIPHWGTLDLFVLSTVNKQVRKQKLGKARRPPPPPFGGERLSREPAAYPLHGSGDTPPPRSPEGISHPVVPPPWAGVGE